MNLENLKIILADDNNILRKMMANNLVIYGFKRENIQQAKNGQEALEILEDFVPDLVITDYNMPLVNGIDLAKKMKATEKWKNIPIAFHSADSSIGYICHKENVDAHIIDFSATTKDIIEFIEEIFPGKE